MKNSENLKNPINVKKATKSEKDFYITITESKKIGETEFQKHKIFLYKEDFEKFADALAEAVDFVHDELQKRGIPLTSSSPLPIDTSTE